MRFRMRAGRLGLAALPALFLLPSPNQGATRPVVINVTCAGPGVNFTLTPWRVGLSAANPVEWRIVGSANTDEITINPVTAGDWPFQEDPPFRATKAAPKGGGALKGGLQSGQVFHYSVTLTCQAPNGQAYRVVIDPDMVVD